jgi:hypothetical protein
MMRPAKAALRAHRASLTVACALLIGRAISSVAALLHAAALSTASWRGDDPALGPLKPIRRGADAGTRIEPGRASPVETAPMFTLAEDWERFKR